MAALTVKCHDCETEDSLPNPVSWLLDSPGHAHKQAHGHFPSINTLTCACGATCQFGPKTVEPPEDPFFAFKRTMNFVMRHQAHQPS